MTVKKENYTIALFLDSLFGLGVYQASIWEGVQNRVNETGCTLVCYSGGGLNIQAESGLLRNRIYDFLDKEKIRGLIIAGSVGSYVSKDVFKAFHESFRPVPTVSVNTPIEGIPSIVVDNYGGVFKAVSHLIDEHHLKHLAFIKGPDEVPEANDRFQAYIDVLKNNGITPDSRLIFNGNFSAQAGINAVKNLLQIKDLHCDGIVAANDIMAISAAQELNRNGVKIPEDMVIAGFDDIEDAGSMVPSLTTVRQPVQSLGKTAVDTIIKMIQGEKVPLTVSNPTSLVIRQSCGCNAASVKKIINKENRPHDFKQLPFEKIKEELTARIIKEAFPFSMGIGFTQKISGLVNDLNDDIRLSRELSGFLVKLEKIIYAPDGQFYQITDWYQALSILKEGFVNYCTKTEDIIALFDIIHYADILIGEYNKIKQNVNKNQIVFESQSLLTVGFDLISNFNLSHMMDVLKNELSLLEIPQCFVVLFKYIGDKGGKEKNSTPKYSRLMLAYSGNKPFEVAEDKAQFLTSELLPKPFKPYRDNIVVDSLVFYNEFFGYIVFNSDPKKSVIYNTLRNNLSIALMGTFLLRDRMLAEEKLKYTLSELEKTNTILENISRRDELTGLLNRRGFIETGREYHKSAVNKKEKYLLFFADLDYLKSINDTYGHKEGDFALRQVSLIIKSAFRDTDIMGRIGGDEFTVIALHTSKRYGETIKNNLLTIMEIVNDEIKKPYRISISTGVYEYDYTVNRDITFDQMIAEADKALYIEKKKRKKDAGGLQA